MMPPVSLATIESIEGYGQVISAEVARGTGVLAEEPITTATVRASDGRERVVRIVGGKTKNGGFVYLAGHVVPTVGARVRFDLRDPRPWFAAESHEPPRGWAPNTPAGTWPVTELPVTFVLALPGSRDLGADAASEIDVALRTWPRVACTGWRALWGSTRAATPSDDGVNGVFFHDDVWPSELVPGALGQTIVHLDANGSIHDADVHINGAEYRFSRDGKGGTIDARGVLVHELGHALGLGHSTDARATMAVAGSGLRWRSLEKDDKDGVCALYPGAGGAGCDTDACPSGFACVAGGCQRPFDRADVCAPCARVEGACEGAGDDARCVDVGDGASAGRVCGRACATDDECGKNFRCLPTTLAGDRQCISDDACRSATHPCTMSANCKDSACLGGSCKGAPDGVLGDGGTDANADAAAPPTTETFAVGGGCACTAARVRPGGSPAAHVRANGVAFWSVIAGICMALCRVFKMHTCKHDPTSPRCTACRRHPLGRRDRVRKNG